MIKLFRMLGFVLCVTNFSFIWAEAIENLLPEERTTVSIFQKNAPKVVFVHRLARVVNHSYEMMHVSAGAGSGIIWDDEGHIVTNFHVINNAQDIAVTIGKMTYPVEVIGTEPRKDLAVLKLKSKKAIESLKGFEPFKLAKSEDLLVGQKVIAIGNPFGLDHSLTTGVISALGRQIKGIAGNTIRDMVQTDAAINPGNSGGPLLDTQGRLIGLNTVIYSSSGSSAGVGFCIPSDDIERIVTQIIKHGRVVLAGIGIQRVEPKIAQQLGVEKGVLVASVLPGTPAESQGLRGTYRDRLGRIVLGDIIVAVNGHTVNNYDQLYNFLSGIPVGDKVTVTVKRGDKQIESQMKTIDIAAY
jgi:S1-C subfamily serine protease